MNDTEMEPRRFFNTRNQRAEKERRRPYQPVAPGIRTRQNRLCAYVTVSGKTYHRNFPKDSDLEAIQAWREHMKAAHGNVRVEPYRRPLPPSVDGWCYLYFVQQGHAVKVGRATNVTRRIEELQTASALPLTLLVAVAAHVSLEKEYLKRLAPYHLSGEWYLYGREITMIVRHLQAGANPGGNCCFTWHRIVSPD